MHISSYLLEFSGHWSDVRFRVIDTDEHPKPTETLPALKTHQSTAEDKTIILQFLHSTAGGVAGDVINSPDE